MTDLRVVSDDEAQDEEAPAEGGFTVGDAANAIADLAAQIHRDHKGFLPSDAMKAVELAITQHLAVQQMQLAYAPQMAAPEPTLDIDALARLGAMGLAEDDPNVQHETPTEEGY